MRKNKVTLSLSPLALLTLAACGGGSTSGGGGAASTTTTGSVQNGPLAKAWAFLDLDGDGVWDANETRIRTENDGDSANGPGYYTLSTTATDYTLVAYTDATTIDTTTNTAYGAGVTLKAPKGSSKITPNTTLVESVMAANTGLTATEAATKVAVAMGLPVGMNVLTYDAYADQASMTNTEKEAALAVQQANNKIMTVVNTFAAVADGSGMSATASFDLAMGSIADVVKAKVTTGAVLSFTTDMAAIVTAVEDDLETYAAANTSLNISVTDFKAVMVEAKKAVDNVVVKIDAFDITTSDADKAAVVSTISTVVEEVRTVAVSVDTGATDVAAIVIDSADPAKLDLAIANNAPTDITLTNVGGSVVTTVEIAENTISKIIGTMAAVDADASDTFKYVISGGDDAAKFTIDADTGVLSLLAQPDYETQDSYEVGIKVTDTGGTGKPYVEVFTFTVGDINEAQTLNRTVLLNPDGEAGV
ncbi:cadherin repeat domain-containing protein, partial [Planktomarina sp.]|nr:cadherin repeat domain-containing protein [Planktomarina sp.]